MDAVRKQVIRKSVAKPDLPPFKVHRDKAAWKSIGTRNDTSISATRQLATTSTINKENVDPKSGLLVRKSSSDCKKRKGDALSTKPLVIKESTFLPKKRKMSSPVSHCSSMGSAGRMPRRGTALSGRRTLSLPIVKEESDADVTTPAESAPLRLSPGLIDARCYELTVLPLADISEAHDCSGSDEESVSTLESSDKGSPPSPESLPPRSPRSKSSRVSPKFGSDDFTLSTPERKSLYSSFTFSTTATSSKEQASEFGELGFADPLIGATVFHH